ncbi:amino acid permease [Rothia aerolata]|uniref:Lysine-specific permease n=1 Tax=Rothia aerolata TaxID=1812262 RepID=A0A917IR20_9MICC|nr:amino acid permease [Rothia aerolata]GGH60006.1 lysine-specific permease [Rothia aerolata]
MSEISREETPQSEKDLNRGLKTRHMQMIAIGGAIGTGLFVASGATVASAGPGGALLAYALIGFMVLLLMQSLGEMSSHLPVPGSFQTFASRYVSPSFGFAIGWNYWFNWAITVAAELVAAGIVMNFWLPDVPGWVWAGVFLVLLLALNALSARAYGEGEFWLATIKVVTVIVFLIAGLAMILGIMGGNSPGFDNWTTGDAPFVGGPISVIAIFMIAGFSFQGTEMVGVAAGESENPRRDVPKAINSVFWRILLFYIGAFIIIGFLIPYTDPNLLRADDTDISFSPFTLVFERAGVAFAASVMNAVILTAILSAGNSGLYVSSRMLYSLAIEGKAPKIFARVNKRGIPMPALLMTTAVGLFGFLTAVMGEGGAYTWLVNISGLSGFIAWVGIAVCHYRFRRAFIKQGHSLKELPYVAPLFPLGPIIAMIMCILVILGQNYEAVFKGMFLEVATAYIGLPVFLAVWLIYKVVTKDKLIPLEQVDVSGLDVPQKPAAK